MSYKNGIVIRCNNGNVIYNSTGEMISRKTIKPKKNKHTNNKIIHQVFVKMIEFTVCDYWFPFLGDCGKNKFPKNFFYNDNYLSHAIKGKSHPRTLYIPNDPTDEHFIEFKLFLKEGGIMPYEEKHEVHVVEKIKIISKWKDIGKDKNDYLLEYVEKIYKDKENVNEKDKNNIYESIKLAIIGGVINPDDIQIVNGKIDHINEVIWDEKVFKIDTSNFSSKNYKNIKYEEEGISNTKTTIN